MIDKLKESWVFFKKWFWALPLWKRTILTSIVGAIGGSSFLGFVNRYALYYHALRQGFRVPVEGVAYLDLAVSLISFGVILASILGTIIIYNILNFISYFTAKTVILFNRNRFKGNLKEIKKYTELGTGILSFIMGILVIFDSALISFKTIISEKNDLDANLIAYFIFPIISVFILSLLSVFGEKARKTLTLIIVALGITVITLSLFNQKVYSSFLKKIQYGGGISVQIEYRKADNTETESSGALMIRTSESITIKNQVTGNLEEIPAERISKIVFVKE